MTADLMNRESNAPAGREPWRSPLKLLGVLALGAVFALGATASAKVEVVPEEELVPALSHQRAALVVNKVMERYHYRRHSLDDAMSVRILDEYLDALDPNRSFLLDADVQSFRKQYEKALDDDLRRARLDAAFDIFKTFRARVEEAVTKALTLVDSDFDFTKREEYVVEREEEPWPRTVAERDELWRKRVKNDVLGLRLAGKTEDELRETLRTRYEGIRRRTKQLDADDVFQVFINAYTGGLEPHTAYMLPHNAENFDISMRLSLEGIGAVLRGEDEYTEVQEIVTGGPADASGQLHAGDRIVGVAQGEDGAMEDVVGWRLQDVVELIRGPKGSIVRLSVLAKRKGKHAPPIEVVIVRDKIKLEEQAAKKSVIEDVPGLDGLRIGVLEVPAFYRDFRGASQGEKNFRSTTRDVRRLLTELREEGVDGIVVDLRDNGGGSLTEATELTGLFIETGPVVQIRDYAGDVDLEKDSDPDQVYQGPMAVLVNRNSASASEIFAGAMQDYGRAVIIGEPTFGKGTVQQLVELGQYLSGKKDIGRLRMTIAQFFRVNGGSTQHKGVVPDILYPTVGEVDYGERSLDNALPWDSIKPATFKSWSLGSLETVRDRHAERVAQDSGFNYLKEEATLIEALQHKHAVSLNEAERKAEREQREEERLAIRNRYRQSLGLQPLTRSEVEDDDDEVIKARNEEEKLEAVQLTEAARILADVIRTGGSPVIHSAQVAAKKAEDPFQIR